MFGLSSLMLSHLDLQVSMRDIVSPNIVNGFGAGFIFVPLAGVMVGTLPNEQIGNATGIQNLVRNVGGSIGISFVSTMIERYAQAHQAFLVGRLSALNPQYQQRVAAVQHIFASSQSPADALHHAQGFLYNVVLLQASYWAFVQLFYQIAWLCAFCLACTFILRKITSTRPVALH
jgi:DHA2 family multidrug resistance protein